MDTKDQYLLFIENDNSKFYYKNGKLHREAGPAILFSTDNILISDITTDDHLYKKVFDLKDVENLKDEQVDVIIAKLILSKWDLPRHYYYLEGVEYSKEEFNAIILEKNLSSANNTQDKKTKV